MLTNDRHEETIAARLLAQGYPARFVYPPAYRLYRLLRIRAPLPARMNLSEHLFFGGFATLLVFSCVYGVAWGLGFVSRVPTLAIVLPAVVIPLLDWLRYRPARRRIDADDAS